jgi:hypothetical protein
MSFPYKNPITASQISGTESASRTSTFGTNFSVLQTGGYMEVYTLSDLNWSTYGATGAIKILVIQYQFNLLLVGLLTH